VEEHSMPLWNPKAFGIRQWHPVRKPTVGQTMYEVGNKAGVRICRTTLDRRAG